jgi:hypothetical protein
MQLGVALSLYFHPVRVSVFLAWRYRISYIGFVGMLLMYCMRVNMSLAIVCMVKPMSHYVNVTDVTTNATNVTYSHNGTIDVAESGCEDLTKKSGNDTHVS